MSFFNDFFNEIGFNSSERLAVTVVFGKGAYVFGAYKILALAESEIVVLVKKKYYKIFGEKLKIKTMSKGEMVIVGNVVGATENG
jgi:hypothetical protein